MSAASTSLPAAAAPRPAAGSRWLPWLVLAALAAFPLIAPAMGLDYYVEFVRRVLIVTIAAAGLNVILGYGGMVALGQAGFIGVGAYAVVAMIDAGYDQIWGAWLAAMIAAAVVAIPIGAISLRTRGVYFIMITLAFAQMLYYLAVSLSTYGGDDGYGIYTPLSLGWFEGLHTHGLYWVVLAVSALVFVLVGRLAGSRFGVALKGIRDNETRMAAMGYPVYALKLTAFVGAAALAGLTGGMLAINNAFVSPSVMHWTESSTLIVMVVIGGLGRTWGAPLGVALWMILTEMLKLHTAYWHWPMGVILILIVFFAPHGLAALRDRTRGAA